MNRPALTIVLIFLAGVTLHAQDTVMVELEALQKIAERNNASLRAGALSVERQQELVSQGYNWDRTNLFYSYDENNIAENGQAIRVWGVRQSFEFPSVYHASKQSLLAQVERSRQEYELGRFILRKNVAKAYYQVAYYAALQQRYSYLDSIYRRFSQAALRRFETGESNYLERITAEAKMKEAGLLLSRNRQDLNSAYIELQATVQSDSIIRIPENGLSKEVIPVMAQLQDHPGLMAWRAQELMAGWETRTAKNQLIPGLQLSYFQGTNSAPDARLYQGVEVGIAIPLLYGTQKGQIRAGKIQEGIYANQRENYLIRLQAAREVLLNRLDQVREALDYYENSGRDLVGEILRTSQRSYQEGEINYFQYIQSLDNALQIELTYLDNLLEYNSIVIDLQYLTVDQ